MTVAVHATPPCLVGFGDLVGEGLGGREAAKRLLVHRLATDTVYQRFLELKKDPAFRGVSDSLLVDTARERVRANLGSKEMEQLFDRAVVDLRTGLERSGLPYQAPPQTKGTPAEGRKTLDRELSLFNAVTPLQGPESTRTTPFEDFMMARLAFRHLIAKGKGTANAAHIQEHLNVLKDPAIAEGLAAAGISELALTRNILLHDLGKEYDQLPADYRAFLEEVFPLPSSPIEADKNYLSRVVMSHEFGSMVMTEQLGKEAGLSAAKIARLKSQFAHHNAGYDPNLPGFHFWVQPFAWGAFAKGMRAKGVNMPETYAAVPSMKEGGSPEAIILTAIDRATSLTLSSQEKFSPVILNGGKWNNEGLAGLFEGNAKNVFAEVDNVVQKLDGRARRVAGPLMKAFLVDLTRLENLAKEVPLMGKGEGPYRDRPATTPEQLASSIVYRTRKGRWFRVDKEGTVFTSEGGGQPWMEAPPEIGPRDPISSLFRQVIYPDQNYTAPVLTEPKALTEFPNLGQ